MKTLIALLLLSVSVVGFAANEYELIARPKAEDPNAAPRATTWQAQNAEALAAATSDAEVLSYLACPCGGYGILSRIRPAYATDPLDAERISAITQYVMVDAGSSWWQFWREHRDGLRRRWTQALLRRASAAADEYVVIFCLDQLRWCGYADQDADLAALEAKSSPRVREFLGMLRRELKGACR